MVILRERKVKLEMRVESGTEAQKDSFKVTHLIVRFSGCERKA